MAKALHLENTQIEKRKKKLTKMNMRKEPKRIYGMAIRPIIGPTDKLMI